jgi:hypothetical protein
VPLVGPADTEDPLCLASCNAAGQGAQLVFAGAAVGGANPAGDEIEGVGEPCGLLASHPAENHATAATTTAAASPDTPGILTLTILAYPNGFKPPAYVVQAIVPATGWRHSPR